MRCARRDAGIASAWQRLQAFSPVFLAGNGWVRLWQGYKTYDQFSVAVASASSVIRSATPNRLSRVCVGGRSCCQDHPWSYGL